MPALKDAIYSRSLGFSEVSALIGDRLYPLVIPQDAEMPAAAYQIISGVPERSHNGYSGLQRARVQFTCQADSYDDAHALSKALRHCWESFKGSVAGLSIGGAFVENDFDTSTDVPVRRLDVLIWHNED